METSDSLVFTLASSDQDLLQILDLQKQNLYTTISLKESTMEGFVTVEHTLDKLRLLNSTYRHAICKVENKVVGYTLAMDKAFKNEIPILLPMFDQIDKISYLGKPLIDVRYIVMGQVCIDKSYRGRDIFTRLYATLRDQLRNDFDYIITEISLRNPRSIRAHLKCGFRTIKEYTSELDNQDWCIVLWDWQ